MHDLLDAVHSDGALERTISSPVGEMPGDTFARLVAFDGLVHGSGIARATGSPGSCPTRWWQSASFARAAPSNDLRNGDTFKDATTPPANATPIEQVAAFNGRMV